MAELFCNIKGVETAMDVISINDPTAEEHDKILVDVLNICDKKSNLKLNREKTNIGKDQVEYIGHILSRDGFKISRKIIEYIKNMPDSMNVKGVMTILGMLTYTCTFLSNVSSVTAPLRQLIKDSSKPGYWFMFDEQHKQSFTELKKTMSST